MQGHPVVRQMHPKNTKCRTYHRNLAAKNPKEAFLIDNEKDLEQLLLEKSTGKTNKKDFKIIYELPSIINNVINIGNCVKTCSKKLELYGTQGEKILALKRPGFYSALFTSEPQNYPCSKSFAEKVDVWIVDRRGI